MRALFVLVVVLFACVGCGPAAMPKPTAPAWITSALGGPPDAVIVLRIDKAANDPVYAPIFRDGAPSEGIMAAVAAIRSIELWMVNDGKVPSDGSMVVVVHGTPRLNAILAESDLWRRRSREGTSRPLPNGGVAWTLPSSDGAGSVAIVQYPSGVWVMGVQRAVTPVLDAAARGVEPVPTDYASDMLFVVQGTKAMSRHAEPAPAPGAEGIELFSAGIGEGGRGDIVGSATYDTEEHADIAFKLSELMLRTMGRKYAEKCRALEQLSLQIDRKGRTVEMRVSNIPQVLLAAKQTCKSDDVAKPTPPRTDPQPQYTQPTTPAGAYPSATATPPPTRAEPEACVLARSVRKNYAPSAAQYLRSLEQQCRAAGGKP